MRQPE